MLPLEVYLHCSYSVVNRLVTSAIVYEMTYNVFSGTLNPTHLLIYIVSLKDVMF